MAFKKKKKDVEAAEDLENTQDSEAEIVEDPLTKAERERDEAIGNWQRALADYKNLNRRSLETINSAVRNTRTELLAELLLVIDYLDMALLAECTTEEASNLHFGVSLTRDQMLGVLERFEVKPISDLESFDPTLHQAVAKVEDPEREEGDIVEIKRKGYMIGDKVLRHADVHVIGVEDPPAVEVLPDEDSAKSDAPDEGAAPEEEPSEA